MFTGTISHEGEQEPPIQTLDMAIQCAIQMRAQKDGLGAPRLIRGFDLADGSQAYVLDMEHVWRIHVVPPAEGYAVDEYEAPRADFPLFHTATIAGFLSGAVRVTTVDQATSEEVESGERPAGWHIRNDNFTLMQESAQLFSVPEASHKIAIVEDMLFAPAFLRMFSDSIFSQFAVMEPGNYTGAMSHVVQLLLGVGNILDYDYEARWLDANPDEAPLMAKMVDLDPITQELDEDEGPPTSFYTGEGNTHVRIQYDWRWNRTNGIMWGLTNKGEPAPMLMELGQRGIFAMPFPVDSLSKTDAVQAHYEKVYPDLQRFRPFRGGQDTLFEALGGFPTGETFPSSTAQMERWVRAGYVLSPENDLEDFYAGFAMTTNFGWSFHPDRPRAINTMYTYNAVGQKIGHCYEVEMTIQEKPPEAKVRNTVTSMVVQALGLTEFIDKFKAERLPQDFAESMVSSPDYEAFDAFEVTPDWEIRAQIYELRRGFLEYPHYQCTKGPSKGCGILKTAPHFKYYEPVLGLVFNFNFEKGEDVPDPPRSDGPIFATYVNGRAEILHYFHEYLDVEKEDINTRQYCQYVGRWEAGFKSEGNKLVGQFYTTSRDFRQRMDVGSGYMTTYLGEVIGNYDFLYFCQFFASHGLVDKRYVGTEERFTETWNAKNHAVSVSCASNNRSMFFVCRETVRQDVRESYTFSGPMFIGRSGARLYASIYAFTAHWLPWCKQDGHPDFGDPACRMVFSGPEIFDPDACHGTEPPGEFTYSICCYKNGKIVVGCGGGADIIYNVPMGGRAFALSVPTTPPPNAPPYHATDLTPPVWEYEYEVYAFGHPLMHNRRIRHWEETVTDPQRWTPSAAYPMWWICSIPDDCPAYPWRVVANYYGPSYVGTSIEFGLDWVEYGYRPSATGRFFGVVY